MSIDCDKYNNIYACGYAALGYPNGENYTIFYSENDSIIINDVDMVQSFLIKYDSIGNFLKYSGIKFTQTDSNIFNASPHTVHSKLQINAATNSLFTQTSCTQGVAFNPASIFGYFTLGEGHTDTTGRYRNGMFIQYDLDDLHYVSHGVAKSDIESGLSTMQVNNNRVFAQFTFFNNLDTLINYNNKYMSSSAFIYWDTDEHLINAICYKDTLTGQSNYIGPLALTDSIVYLSGATRTTMYFGEYSIPGSYAYIAKYTDPEFMTPYIYTEPKDTTSGISDIDGIDITIYPNPAKDNIIIQSASNIISDCFITDITGNKYPLQLNKQENGYITDISNLERGLYILTLITESKIINSKIIKQ